MTREEELRDIRAELKALSSLEVELGTWDQPAEECTERVMLRRRRWAYLEDKLNVVPKGEKTEL